MSGLKCHYTQLESSTPTPANLPHACSKPAMPSRLETVLRDGRGMGLSHTGLRVCAHFFIRCRASVRSFSQNCGRMWTHCRHRPPPALTEVAHGGWEDMNAWQPFCCIHWPRRNVFMAAGEWPSLPRIKSRPTCSSRWCRVIVLSR